MTLKASLVAGKPRIALRARGANLGVPPLGGVTAPVTVQLSNLDGACWEAVYSEPFRRHDARVLQDKAD